MTVRWAAELLESFRSAAQSSSQAPGKAAIARQHKLRAKCNQHVENLAPIAPSEMRYLLSSCKTHGLFRSKLVDDRRPSEASVPSPNGSSRPWLWLAWIAGNPESKRFLGSEDEIPSSVRHDHLGAFRSLRYIHVTIAATSINACSYIRGIYVYSLACSASDSDEQHNGESMAQQRSPR